MVCTSVPQQCPVGSVCLGFSRQQILETDDILGTFLEALLFTFGRLMGPESFLSHGGLCPGLGSVWTHKWTVLGMPRAGVSVDPQMGYGGHSVEN